MKLNVHKYILTIFFILFATSSTVLAQGAEIAMGKLAETIEFIENIFLLVALLNIILIVTSWYTKKVGLIIIPLILLIPSMWIGLTGYHDNPLVAIVNLLSGTLSLSTLILRKFIKYRF